MTPRLSLALWACTLLACGDAGSSGATAPVDTDVGSTAGSDGEASDAEGSGDTGPDSADSGDTAQTSDTTDPTDTGDTGPSCEATHTSEEASQWTLPTPIASVQYEPFEHLGGNTYCTGQDTADFGYTTIDLTGDGVLDLVVTSACDDGDVGTDFWLVYAGGADGFAEEPSPWTLPTPIANVQYEPFLHLGGETYCTGQAIADFRYTTVDLTGDGQLDLVITSACDVGDVGTDVWLVHAGGAGGFAEEPSTWTLPTPVASVQYEPFLHLGGETYCTGEGNADFHYTTIDLTGDGLLDLVITSACDDGDVGTDAWLVHAGGAGGFAEEPSLWSLPTPIANVQYEPFLHLGGETYCTGQDIADFRYTTVDLTGDGLLDLVVTSACDDGDVGTDSWLVHAGGEDGFAEEPSLWRLPEPVASVEYEPFLQLGGSTYCTGSDVADFEYTTVDLTADGVLDLVMTSACDDGGVGTDGWLVYAGGDDGFASEPFLWTLPDPIANVEYEPYAQLGGATYCTGQDTADFHYTTVDLDGDEILDLVVTSACDDGGVGTDFWLLYPGACE